MLSKQTLLRLTILPIIGFVICGVTLLFPWLHARYLLHELNNLRINYSTFEDAQRLAKRVGAVPSDECNHTECRWYKSIDNARFPTWYRGKGATVAIIFGVEDSILIDKGVEYSIGLGPFTANEAFLGRPRVYVAESESWFKSRAEKQRELQKRFPKKFPDYVETPVTKGWEKIWYDANGNVAVDFFAVDISPRSTTIPEDWKKYTAFNYSCLWKYKGCNYGKDLLPTADPYPPHPPS